MADESTTPTTERDEPTATTSEPTAEPDEPTATTSAAEAPTPQAADGPAGPAGGPVPGDPSSEPVATALQSWDPGMRTGPQTIAQDSDAPWHTPAGLPQVAPGEVVPPDHPASGAIAGATVDPQTVATLGMERGAPVTAAELPAGVPVPSSLASTGGPVSSPPTSAAPVETSESAGAAPSGESGATTPDDDEPAPTGTPATRTSTSSDSG